jgi:D-alanine-D-alanine ligase
MRVGLTYDLQDEYPPTAGSPPDYNAEYDSEESIQHLQAAIEGLGHNVHRIGNVHKLMRYLVGGSSVDIVFNMAEGVWGRSREAQVPAILEAFQVPYTGSDPLTSALCLDKAAIKRLWQAEGLPTPRFRVVSDLAQLDEPRLDLPFPLFVKPVHEGSSKGVGLDSIVESERSLRDRVEWVLSWYRQPALVEEFMPGREFTVGILGNNGTAGVLGAAEITILAQDPVNGREQKERWEARVAEKFVPVGSPHLRSRLCEIALQAYHVAGCRDVGRVDLRQDAAGDPQLLEINPLVGLHPTHSALPVIGLQAGLSFQDLIGEILEHAVARWFLH